jgi:NACHT domain
MNSEEPIFWISGKAGSGKSTLMKYIVNDKQTIEQLNQQSRDYVIYSYFIWNSETKMQRNLKGMYCSLLLQIFQKHSTLIDKLLESHTALNEKRSPPDWELSELKSALNDSLRSHKQQVCLFIDGLDEIDSHETSFDLKFLTRDLCNGVPNLKICFSSRPEPVWKTQLAKYPSVKVQDLTEEDMSMVARELLEDIIETGSDPPSPKAVNRLINTLLYKSEGVFLWLRLAIKSVRRGLSNNDDWETLQARIDALPSDLNEMYKQMWDRLGEDTKFYKQQAALYFNLVLECLRHSWPQVTLYSFHLTAACSPAVQANVFRAKDEYVLNSMLEAECRKTNSQIESHCAGLLEVHPGTKHHEQIQLDGSSPILFRINFVHRTARDFLLFSIEGQSVLDHCTLDSVEITCSLAKALLCQCVVFGEHEIGGQRILSWAPKSHIAQNFSIRTVLRSVRLRYTCWLLSEIQKNPAAWQKESPKLLGTLKEVIGRKYVGSSLENIAEFGLVRPIQDFLDSYDAPADQLSRFLSYLLWQFSPHTMLENSSFVEWILGQEPNLDWAFPHEFRFGSGDIQIMLTFAESILVRSYPVINLVYVSRVFQLMGTFLEGRQLTSRKIFMPISIAFEVSKTSRLVERLSIYPITGNDSEIVKKLSHSPVQRQFDVIVETSIPGLLREVVSGTFASPNDLDLDSLLRGLPGEAILRQIINEPSSCWGKVILVNSTLIMEESSYSNYFKQGELSSHEYCAVPESLSEELLKGICAALKFIYSEDQQSISSDSEMLKGDIPDLLGLHETIKAASDERVNDIKGWLRNRGYFIPSAVDVQTVQYRYSTEERFRAADDLNRRMNEWENNHKAKTEATVAQN